MTPQSGNQLGFRDDDQYLTVKSFPLQRRKIIIKGSVEEKSGKKRAKNIFFLDVNLEKCTQKVQMMQKIRWR